MLNGNRHSEIMEYFNIAGVDEFREMWGKLTLDEKDFFRFTPWW